MTEELKQAAQQALMECPFCGSEPHDAHHIEYGRWAVTCRCGAKGASANTGPNATDAAKIKAYSDARTAWNTRALTQRPAAQEGEVDIKSRVSELIAEHGTLRAAARSLNIDVGYLSRLEHGDKVHPSSETLAKIGLRDAGVKYQRLVFLPTQPAAQATPDQFADASKLVAPVALRSVHLTRDTVGMCIVRINGRVAIRDNGDIIDHTATLEWFADTQQATSEPVGEPWGWAIEDKHGVAQAIRPARKEFFGCVQSTDPFTAEDIAKMDREWPGIAPHHVVTLYPRPAPGVPDGLPAVLTDWGFDVHDDEEGRTWLLIRNDQDDVARLSVPTFWPASGRQTIGAVVLHQFSAALTSALAAAQAKGGQA